MPLWAPIVECWIATGATPWPAHYGLLDAPGSALWLARWRCYSAKLAKRQAGKSTADPEHDEPGVY